MPDDNHNAAVVVIPRDCITCDGPGCSETGPEKRCSRCRVTYYCGKDCQVRHFKQHKNNCRRIALLWQERERTFPVVEPVQQECGICLEVHPEKRVLVPGCNHGFCYPCLLSWHNKLPNIEELEQEEPPTTCPICRNPISQRVEDDVLDRARYLAKRAAVAATPEEKDALTQEAFAEIDRLMSSNNEFQAILKYCEFRPLIVKAEILTIIGEPQRSLDMITAIQDRYETADRNGEKFASMLAQLQQTTSQDEVEQLKKEILEMNARGEVITTGDPTELALKMDYRIVGTEAWAEKGEHEFALKYYMHMFEKSTSNEISLSPKHYRRIGVGLLSSNYHLGNYEGVLMIGNQALNQTREFPHVYKYMALAQRDQGDVVVARDTANKGLLYAVMDEFEKAELLDLYKELVEQTS